MVKTPAQQRDMLLSAVLRYIDTVNNHVQTPKFSDEEQAMRTLTTIAFEIEHDVRLAGDKAKEVPPGEGATIWCTCVPEKDGTHQPDCIGEGTDERAEHP